MTRATLQAFLACAMHGQGATLPAANCRVQTTASEAGSYGVDGCGGSHPMPYCCSASSRSDPHFPAGVRCERDNSGDVRGGSCPRRAFSHPACCHKGVTASGPAKAATQASAPAYTPTGNVSAASCQRILTTADASGSFVDGCAPFASYCCQGTRDQIDSDPASVTCSPSAPGTVFGCTSGYFSCC